MNYVNCTPSTNCGDATTDSVVIRKIDICIEFYRLGCLLNTENKFLTKLLVRYIATITPQA
jgi:hypothetical protein